MSLSLVASDNAKPKTFIYIFNKVKQEVHTYLPLNRHMNGGESIHIDSYKESHLDSHQGGLVSDNVTKIAPTMP